MLAHSFSTVLGTVTAVESEGHIVRIAFGILPDVIEEVSDILTETERQITEYLSGERREFTVPTLFDGSDFAKDVMEAMMHIPYGTVMTYSQLAEASGHPSAQRAVGTVCRNNPLPIIFPCHRVVPSGKGIGNYSGPSGIKEKLLKIEGFTAGDS